MIQPDERVIAGFLHITQNVPAVKDWLIRCADTELDRLPQTVTSTAIAQGRCQVLQELRKLLEDAPELAAQSRKGSRAQLRTPIGA